MPRYFHGTFAELKPGDVLRSAVDRGESPNFPDSDAAVVYVTTDPAEAAWYGEQLSEFDDRVWRVYSVRPQGRVSRDTEGEANSFTCSSATVIGLAPTQASFSRRAHRRCERCGQAMPRRMHRTTDTKGRKVCQSCATTTDGSDWNVTYAGLSTEAGPRYADPATHPFFQANPVHHDNIVATYNRATADDKLKGATWYHGAHLVAKAIGQGDAAKGAGLLAIYSPNTAWPTNMFNAATAMERKEGIGGKGSGFFASASQKAAADKVLGGAHYTDVLKGPKIRDFAHLIENDGDADDNEPHAVIDRHAMSVASGRRLSDDELDSAPLSTDHYYRHVVNAYKKAADVLSAQTGRHVSPHQVQATTWLVQQRENAQADAASSHRLDRGRGTAQDNAQKRWNQYAEQHYPDLSGPGWHNERAAALDDFEGALRIRPGVDPGVEFYDGEHHTGINPGADGITNGTCLDCGFTDGFTEVDVARDEMMDHALNPGRTASLQTTAHDSGDGETIYHCPFCGAGSVVGSSNGTVACQFCHTNFTVQVQPEFKAMPQTINGQPYNIPGMPGGGPDAGASAQQQRNDQLSAQDGATPPLDAQPDEQPASMDAAFEQHVNGAPPVAAHKTAASIYSIPTASLESELASLKLIDDPTDGQSQRMSVIQAELAARARVTPPKGTASFRVGSVELDRKAFLQRIALAFADDRDEVLAVVREENGVTS